MSQEKDIGMDVHQATISAAVMDVHGKLLMECLLETKASTIVEFIQGLQGRYPSFLRKETPRPGLHDLLKPHDHPENAKLPIVPRQGLCHFCAMYLFEV